MFMESLKYSFAYTFPCSHKIPNATHDKHIYFLKNFKSILDSFSLKVEMFDRLSRCIFFYLSLFRMIKKEEEITMQ